MNNLNEIVQQHLSNGFTIVQARYKAAQEVILSKIEQSTYVDKILLKGGIVMYNMTKEQRRTTSDLDLDFIRLNISKRENIEKFINALNRKETQFQLELKDVKPLHQDDYKGCQVNLLVTDTFGSRPIAFTMDIGVHTLLGIEQDKMCFTFDDGKSMSLWVNPPEQMLAEKLFSLAKIGPRSTRYRDVNDMYYLIKHAELDLNCLRQCLSLLVIGDKHGLSDVVDVVSNASVVLESDLFTSGYKGSSALWLNIEYKELKETILNYIYKI